MNADTRRNLLGRLAAMGIAAPAVATAAPGDKVYHFTEAEMDVIERAIEAFARSHEMNRILNAACGQLLHGDLAGGCRTLATLESVIGRAAA